MELITDQLATARKRQARTYRDVAAMTGKSHECISRVEKRKGQFATLVAIADALGFDVRLFDSRNEVLTFALDADNLGEQLRRYRRSVLGLSRDKVADGGKVCTQTIMSVENNINDSRHANVAKYAAALGLSLGLTRKLS